MELGQNKSNKLRWLKTHFLHLLTNIKIYHPQLGEMQILCIFSDPSPGSPLSGEGGGDLLALQGLRVGSICGKEASAHCREDSSTLYSSLGPEKSLAADFMLKRRSHVISPHYKSQ